MNKVVASLLPDRGGNAQRRGGWAKAAASWGTEGGQVSTTNQVDTLDARRVNKLVKRFPTPDLRFEATEADGDALARRSIDGIRIDICVEARRDDAGGGTEAEEAAPFSAMGGVLDIRVTEDAAGEGAGETAGAGADGSTEVVFFAGAVAAEGVGAGCATEGADVEEPAGGAVGARALGAAAALGDGGAGDVADGFASVSGSGPSEGRSTARDAGGEGAGEAVDILTSESANAAAAPSVAAVSPAAADDVLATSCSTSGGNSAEGHVDDFETICREMIGGAGGAAASNSARIRSASRISFSSFLLSGVVFAVIGSSSGREDLIRVPCGVKMSANGSRELDPPGGEGGAADDPSGAFGT